MKGRPPSALCISDVKNKLHLHLGGGGVRSAWCCVGAVWERGLGHLCTTLPRGWEGEANGHLLLASMLCAGMLQDAQRKGLQPKRSILPS